jgi:hypothetical protein
MKGWALTRDRLSLRRMFKMRNVVSCVVKVQAPAPAPAPASQAFAAFAPMAAPRGMPSTMPTARPPMMGGPMAGYPPTGGMPMGGRPPALPSVFDMPGMVMALPRGPQNTNQARPPAPAKPENADPFADLLG